MTISTYNDTLILGTCENGGKDANVDCDGDCRGAVYYVGTRRYVTPDRICESLTKSLCTKEIPNQPPCRWRLRTLETECCQGGRCEASFGTSICEWALTQNPFGGLSYADPGDFRYDNDDGLPEGDEETSGIISDVAKTRAAGGVVNGAYKNYEPPVTKWTSTENLHDYMLAVPTLGCPPSWEIPRTAAECK